MAKQEMAAKLAAWASGSVQPTATVKTEPVETVDLKADIAKIETASSMAVKMYPNDPDKRFNYWTKSVDVGTLSDRSKAVYWAHYEKLHPQGMEGTQREFINVTARELAMIPGQANKEFFLRERISNSPEWAKKILDPELAKLSTAVAVSNLGKATAVYSDDIKNRVHEFTRTSALDPDVTVDDHTADILKLEQMNLFDLATVQNGRVGVLDPKAQFVPAFAIKSRSQVMPNGSYSEPSAFESTFVREQALPHIRTAVEKRLYTTRAEVSRAERASSMEAVNMLESGKFGIQSWGTAFAMIPDTHPMQLIYTGLRGEINSGRVKTHKDLAEAIYTAMTAYKEAWPELTNKAVTSGAGNAANPVS